MTVKETFYGVKCNVCGDLYVSEFMGHAYWGDKSEAINEAREDGWHCSPEGDYCPNCHEVGDDDELIVKTNKVNDMCEEERTCDYVPKSNEPCATCPRLMTALAMCEFLKEPLRKE